MSIVQPTSPLLRQHQRPHYQRIALAGEAGAPAAQFRPLDPSIVSDAIPAFFIGRDGDGLWVAREAKGRIGGLFLLKSSALSFAHARGGLAGCATIYRSERFELDLENEGNPLAHLAPLVRHATRLARRIGAVRDAIMSRSNDFHAL
jgi:hypothetical protein